METIGTQTEVMDEETLDLWLQYSETRDINLRNEIILKYIVIVKKIAFKIYRNYRFSDSPEELVNEGILALIQSVDKFDLNRNVKFETFASRRIQGSMLDYINKQNGYIRKIHDMTKAINKSKEDLRLKHGREPSNIEVAAYLDISIEQLEKNLQEIQPISIISLTQTTYDADMEEKVFELSSGIKDDPLYLIDRDEFCEELIDGIKRLNEEQQLVLSLFYKEELSVREIAEIMETDTTRISQVRFQAVKKLKNLLKNKCK